MKKNNTVEEINTSINNLLEEWNISKEHNNKIVAYIIGLQLKKIRLVNKMTQTRVSKAINVTFQQIQKYEKGLNACSYMNLKMIAEYLNVSIDYFTKPIDDLNLKLLTKRRDNGYYNNRAWTPDRV